MAAQMFIVVADTNPDAVATALKQLPEGTFYPFKSDTWFVEFEGTTTELSSKLGVLKGENGKGVVAVISSYYGFANTDIWEWLRAHWPKVS